MWRELNCDKRRGKAKDKVTVILVKNTLSDVIILRNKRCTWLCFFCTKKCNDFFAGLRVETRHSNHQVRKGIIKLNFWIYWTVEVGHLCHPHPPSPTPPVLAMGWENLNWPTVHHPSWATASMKQAHLGHDTWLFQYFKISHYIFIF